MQQSLRYSQFIRSYMNSNIIYMISYCLLFEKELNIYKVLGETEFAEESQVQWILEKQKAQKK